MKPTKLFWIDDFHPPVLSVRSMQYWVVAKVEIGNVLDLPPRPRTVLRLAAAGVA